MLAEIATATNAQLGTWVIILFAVINGSVGIIGVFSLFATRREFDKLDVRVTKLEEGSVEVVRELSSMAESIRKEVRQHKDELLLSADRRSSVLHNRINPVTVNLSEIKGSMEAFTQSFNSFSEIIKALARERNGSGRSDKQ
jgi:hypothetical protein